MNNNNMSIRNQTQVFLTSLALDVSAEASTRVLHIVHNPSAILTISFNSQLRIWIDSRPCRKR